MQNNIDQIRIATLDEIPVLNQLIKLSADNLSKGYYTPEQIQALNEHIFGVDRTLIIDQTYLVIERDSKLIACGGWSRRAKVFGGDQYTEQTVEYLDPKTDAAKIRAFFIHPDYARQGLATKLLKHCEAEAANYGFRKMELMSTLPGIEFYKAQGFVITKPYAHSLPNAVNIELMAMVKEPISN